MSELQSTPRSAFPDAVLGLIAAGALAIFVLLATSPLAQAAANFNQLAEHYGKLAGKPPASFSAERGKAFWMADHVSDNGEKMNCATCHGKDLKQPGQHNKSGKRIEAMAPSANAERYTDLEKIEKWFTRNCKQVLQRECTAQEKGDVLRYLQQF
jgi:cytochrome c553